MLESCVFCRRARAARRDVDEDKKEKPLPKQKTHKGAAKRFKITGTGKVMRHQAEVRHGLTQKSQKRKRKLGKAVECSPAFSAILRSMLHR